jgi:hypothetical protein
LKPPGPLERDAKQRTIRGGIPWKVSTRDIAFHSSIAVTVARVLNINIFCGQTNKNKKPAKIIPSKMDDEEYDDDQTADDFVEFELLTRFWRNERCAPTLFPYQDRLMDHTKEKGWVECTL